MIVRKSREKEKGKKTKIIKEKEKGKGKAKGEIKDLIQGEREDQYEEQREGPIEGEQGIEVMEIIEKPESDPKKNEFLKNMEKSEYYEKNENTSEESYDFLYPSLNDPDFNIKIAKRKEFFNTRYDGELTDIQKQADIMCNAEFELLPHQQFVKNFLSFQTPYNSLLLYHSLGTGKTCSSIGIAEEMRTFMKQVGIKTFANQRMNANGITFNKDRFESLDTHTMQGRCTIQKDRVILDDFFKNIPHMVVFSFKHFLGRLDGVCVA